jgi:flagellar biosynthetic protein FliR
MLQLAIPLPQILGFFMVFLRVGAILLSLPVFDSRSIPALLKAGLAFALSLVVFPLIAFDRQAAWEGVLPLFLAVAGEVLVGLALGLSVRMMFASVQLAGQLAGFQMGFAIVNVMDPLTAGQVSIIGQLKYLTAILIFFAINAHHLLLRAMAESFHLVPPMGFTPEAGFALHVVAAASGMFGVAVQIGAPIFVALLLASVALGLVARTVPQMNIFIVGMPLKILVGLVMFIFTLPHLSSFLRSLFEGVGEQILRQMFLAG